LPARTPVAGIGKIQPFDCINLNQQSRKISAIVRQLIFFRLFARDLIGQT
jgi:hypothetical protein